MTHPIVQRELVAMLRSRWAATMQISVAVLFAGLVALRWPTDSRVDLAGDQSRAVFSLFGYGVLATLLLLTPIVPATTIVRERIQGTLPLLFNTPMSSWSIYFGKLFGVLGLTLILLAMSLPAAAACYAMGGVSLQGDLLLMYSLLILVVLQYCSFGLLVSVYASSTDSAIRLMYGLVLAITIVSIGPHLLLQGHEGWVSEFAVWLRYLSPIPAFMALLGDADITSQGLVSTAGAPVRYALFALLSTAGCAMACVYRLNHRILDRPKSQGTITDNLGGFDRFERRLTHLIDPQRRKAAIFWFVNPVMVKEFRTRRFGRTHWMLRMIAACIIGSLTLSIFAVIGTIDWGIDTIGAIMVLLQVTLIVLLTPGLASGLISSERESGGWDLLRMTPLSTGKILRGKLMSVFWTVSLILIATVPGYLVLVRFRESMTQQIYHVLISLGLTALFGVLFAAAVGSFFRRTATATTTAYALLLLIYAGPMLVWLGRDAPFGHDLVETVLIANPIATAFSVIKVNGFEQYNLIPANWWFCGIASAVLLIALTLQTRRLTRPT